MLKGGGARGEGRYKHSRAESFINYSDLSGEERRPLRESALALAPTTPFHNSPSLRASRPASCCYRTLLSTNQSTVRLFEKASACHDVRRTGPKCGVDIGPSVKLLRFTFGWGPGGGHGGQCNGFTGEIFQTCYWYELSTSVLNVCCIR